MLLCQYDRMVSALENLTQSLAVKRLKCRQPDAILLSVTLTRELVVGNAAPLFEQT
jgi:hypothetical protein